ncbi:MAG: menaquinone biosynthesis protein [Acidobacteria bacterium]|nr:menaquinone biosynthesis protein [Acidobacteriota bacterium]MCA1637020.1 menaquinone biosynthesis protein [Acidobacteriota bacterium]
MLTPRISASSYSNTAPLIWSFLYGSQRGKYELILDNAPARSAKLLAQKRVSAALVPVIEYQRIENVLLIPNVCVGTKKRVRSVCLVTKGKDLKNVKTISLDVSSRTSVALTQIIFREFFGFEPVYKISKPNLREMLNDSDCALLIGDPALTIDESAYRKFDLAETWKSFTGFGFVFAMWMAQISKAEIARKIDFAEVRDEGLEHLDEIIANYETEISISREDFRKYLTKNISFSIDENMWKGLELYFKLAHKNNLIERDKPLRFIENY